MNWEDYRREVDALPFDPAFEQRALAALETARQSGKGTMKKTSKHISKTVLIAAALVVVLTLSAAAAALLLRPAEVAQHFDDPVLAAAFAGDGALILDESVESAGCRITLAGVVSGAALSDWRQDVDGSRTYAVVALENLDGTPREATVETVVTPLVSGFAPAWVNAWTLRGGFQGFSENGVAYFLFDYEDLEIFAAHTVYLAVYEGFVPSSDEFTMAGDGSIAFREDYNGLHALFTLPLDASHADEAAVQQFLDDTGMRERFES